MINENSPFSESFDFILELGQNRKETEIRLLQLTDTQIIDATQCRTEDRLCPKAAEWRLT